MNKITFRELRMLMTCFTFARFHNLIRLEASRWWSKLRSDPVIWGLPYAISIEPTSYCNLHCQECPSGSGLLTRPQGLISMELYKNIIDEASRHAFYLTLYFQGEPLLHPEIGTMIAYAKSKRMFVFISTNGHFLSQKMITTLIESKLNKIIISLDGATQEDFEHYRVGGNLSTVIEGMNKLTLQRKKANSSHPIIIAQVLLLKTTESNLDAISKMAFAQGVDEVEFKKAQFYNPNREGSLLPQNPEYSKYSYSREKGWHLKQKCSKGCKRLWSSLVVTWNGDVLPCCYDKDATHVFGSLNKISLSVAFRSAEAKNFRKQVFNQKKSIKICQSCGE